MYVLIRYDGQMSDSFKLDMLGLYGGYDTALESMRKDVDLWIDRQNLRNEPEAYERSIRGRYAYATYNDRLTVWVIFDQSFPHTWNSVECL